MSQVASIKKKLAGVFFLFAFLLLSSLVSAPAARADSGGADTPTAYKSSTEAVCVFASSAQVTCALDSKSSSKMDYWYDPVLSAKAGHDVFRPNQGAKASEYGFLHFPNSGSGDYSTGQLSISRTDGSKGKVDSNINDGAGGYILALGKGDTCSLYLARDGKTKTCTNGNGSGQKQTITVNSGFSKAETKGLSEAKNGCDEGGIGFILCPIEKILTTVNEKIVGFIAGALIVQTDSFSSSGSELRTVFNQVLLIANGLFALIFLVIIFGNTLSLGIDSYTIKKALPRLVMAVILAQFSYFIAGSVIEIGNVLCKGILLTLTGGGSLSLGSIGGTPDLFGTIGSILLELTFLVLAFVAVLVGIVVLALRQIILIGLIVAGPIAFAAWVLPGTEKMFKFWWSNLMKLSLMGPIIVGLLAGAFKLQEIVFHGPSGPIVQLGASLLPIIALLYLPKTFKWSGSLMSATGGKIADKGSAQAKKQTVGRAKDAYSKDGGLKDKAAVAGITPSFGRKRLERQGIAEANIQKKAEAGSSTAARIIGAMPGGKDHSADIARGVRLNADEQKEHNEYSAKQKAVADMTKTLRTPEAQAKFAATLAKGGDRSSVATVREAMGSKWDAGVAANYGDFDSMPDMRDSHAKATMADPVTGLTGTQSFVSKMNAESFVKVGGHTQNALTSIDMMPHFSSETLERLGDQGVRSRLSTGALNNLKTYKASLAPGDPRLASLHWL